MTINTRKIITRGLLLLSVNIITACGGGGGGGSSQSSDPSTNPPSESPEPVSLGGYAVKGPLSNADVGVYTVQMGNAALKGTKLASGSTGAIGQFDGIEFELEKSDFYLIEVTADADTLDISTGEAPIIPTLKTFVSADALKKSEPAYATISTTMVFEMLRLKGGVANTTELASQLNSFSTTVATELGFDLLQGIDLFEQSPLVTDTAPATQQLLNYRTALEAQAALIWYISVELGVPVNRVIEWMAADLLDGQYDGLTSLAAADYVDGSRQVFEVAARQLISELSIPGTGALRSGGEGDYLAGETVQLLLAEAAVTAPSADVQLLENAPSTVILAAVGPDMDADGKPDAIDLDIDGDGVANAEDAFPRDPSETMDSDSDGVGDNGDAYPLDGNCSVAAHGDGAQCYMTALSNYDVTDSFADEDGSILLVANSGTELALFRFLPDSQRIEEKIGLAVDGVTPTTILVHKGHQRTYVAYPDGAIRYLAGGEPRLLTNVGFPISDLAFAGNYLFVIGDDEVGETHLTLSSSGQLMYRRDYRSHFESFDWSESRDRLYFRYSSSAPYRLGYMTVNQSTGQFDSGSLYSYDSEFYPEGQVLVLDNVDRVATGSGLVYEMGSSVRSPFDVSPFDRAVYDGNDLVAATASPAGNANVNAYSASGAFYQSLEFTGTPSTLLKRDDDYLLVARDGSGEYRFHTFVTDRDLDDDGVDNVDDHFPADPAASLDTDGDGWPDSWNAGYSEGDSTSGLTLDAYPEDSACQEVNEGNGSECDVESHVVIDEVTQTILHENIVYALSAADQAVYRWDLVNEQLLNPVLLTRELNGAPAVSIAVSDSGKLLVADDSGAVFQVSSSLPLQAQRIYRVTGGDVSLIQAGKQLIVGEATDYGYRRLNVLSEQFEKLADFTVYGDNTELEYHAESGRVYWVEDYSGGSLRSSILDPVSGYPTSSRNFSFGDTGLPVFVSPSTDEERIFVGGDVVVRNLLGKPYLQQLPISDLWPSLSNQFYPRDAFWWSEMAAALFQNGESVWLAAYDTKLNKQLFGLDLGVLDGQQVLQYDEGLVYLEPDAGSGMSFRKLPLLVDGDSDGLPYWWELQFSLDDDNSDDAGQDPDSDGLTNLEEFIASTSARVSDSDGDGLSDGDEVSLYGTDPNSQDSDGDFMPDSWELVAGLDPNSADDMEGDLDSDSYSNYIEFINGSDPSDDTSFPDSVSEVLFSFEDGNVPDELVVVSSPDEIAVSADFASHGALSLSLNGEAAITWERTFSPIELSFDAMSDCYSNYHKNLSVRLDGEEIYSGYPQQSIWKTHKFLVSPGKKELTISVESSSSGCSVYLDNFVVAPLKNIFEMGTSFVGVDNNKIQFYDMEGSLLKEVDVTGNSEYTGYARDISVLEDGRVAVFNGTFEPILSVYSPRRHEWEHYAAPGWSTINNASYGGIDAIGERVFVTNMATSGSPNQGLVVFDLSDGTLEFVSGSGYIDLTVGEDGYLYAFTGSTIDKYDPDTLQVVSQIAVSTGRSVAVNATGEIFVADWSGYVRKYDQSGNQLASLEIGGSFYDISLRMNGDLMVSSRFEDLVVTDSNLSGFVRLPIYAEFIDFTPDIDSDSDDLPDWWEAGNGLDAHNDSDADSDNDMDNLSATEEFALGTRADKADTDGDTVNDGDEVLVRGTDPLNPDTDGDGLNDGEEVAAGTDPNLIDSDSDGLSDRDEVKVYGTDPLSGDSDSDGMDDRYEITYGLDALVNDASGDFDDDGLTNLEESILGSSPIVSDTDGDGLNDFDEYAIHNTSPLLKDTDGDVMRDDWEIAVGLDPNDASDAATDMDSDSFSNLEEFVAHTSPTEQTEFPVPVVWGSSQGGPDHTGYTPWDLDEGDFAFRWSKVFADTPQLNGVAAGDGKVFVSSDSYFGNQRIYGLGSTAGEILWEKSYDDIHSVNPPAYEGGNVYFQSGGHEDSFIRSVDATTGNLLFATSYGNQWSEYLAPTLFDGQLYMAGGYYGGMYSHNAETGVQNWFANTAQYDGFTPAVDEQYVYAFITDFAAYDRLTGELAYRIDFPSFDWHGYDVGMATVLTGLGNSVAIQNGTLVVFDLGQKSILWEKSGSYRGQPSSHLGQIFAIESGVLKVIDESTGTVLWNYEASEPLSSNIVVTRTHVFVGGSTTTFAIDLDSKTSVWNYAASGALGLSDEGVLYISGNALTAIDLLPE
ncbi:PQQ-binding-like beta-propeller repeat protein [Microbulbifer pacificus]|uniref:outer membrane protein assembly factor BamB family protein n=1 Tax=Microbulbifer pacificus TaxID=407164 RepID=UPI000CF38C8D|nr:PQQ-binding-like beta-propeller repeat protein [Microbulbifer pacificus]